MNNQMLAYMMPDLYDRKLDDFDPIVNLPLGKYKSMEIKYQVIEAGYKMEMFGMSGTGGVVSSDKDITITKLLLNGKLWMSNSPSEIEDMKRLSCDATGNVLVAGLGMGMLINLLDKNENVTSITVVELNQDVIDFVSPHLNNKKVQTYVNADIKEYLKNERPEFDFYIYDIWENLCGDNLKPMIELIHRTHKSVGRKIYGSVWGFGVSLEDVYSMVRGCFEPSDTTDLLSNEGFEEIADTMLKWTGGYEYSEDDEDWSDYEDECLTDVIDTLYQVNY